MHLNELCALSDTSTLSLASGVIDGGLPAPDKYLHAVFFALLKGNTNFINFNNSPLGQIMYTMLCI